MYVSEKWQLHPTDIIFLEFRDTHKCQQCYFSFSFKIPQINEQIYILWEQAFSKIAEVKKKSM